MKKVALSLLLLSAVLLNAVQPGLPASDVKFVNEFRLPAWKSMYFDLTLYGSARNSGISNKDYEQEQSEFIRQENFYLNLSPKLKFRSESENNITEIKGELYSRFSYNSSKDKDDHPQMDIDRMIVLKPELTFSNKGYSSNGDFINLGGSINYDYGYFYMNEENEDIERYAVINAILGYGNGKVRDVTPIIKALRFNKRYSSLGKGQFNDNEIGEIAKVISMVPVYYETYDRASKYFWEEMYKAANGKMEGLSGYQTFMVMNGLGDLSGERLEGNDISANARYIWMDENDNTSGHFQNGNSEYRYGVFAPYLLGRYYSNRSIDYQIGFEAEASYQIPTSDKELFEQNILVRLNHNELYCITDRILYIGNATFLYQDRKFEKKDIVQKYEASFKNNFTYYLEDNFSLKLDADVIWDKTERVEENSYTVTDISTEQLTWVFGVSLNYRFRTM